MKRHQEGYVLLYVVVVIAVMSIVAVAVASGAMSNMRAQEASIRRMQEQYTALGYIEELAAQIQEKTSINEVKSVTGQKDGEQTKATIEWPSETDASTNTVSGTVTATAGSTKVTAQLTVEIESGSEKTTVTYGGYTVSAVEEEGDAP